MANKNRLIHMIRATLLLAIGDKQVAPMVNPMLRIKLKRDQVTRARCDSVD